MNLGLRYIYTILAALLLAINVPAQDIPALPKDPAVMDGVMPNGMAYYLVSNPAVKGKADFALVQKTGRLTVKDSSGVKAESIAKETLISLRRFRPSSPIEYLARNEIYPGRDGFVKVTDDATVFMFPDVDLNTAAIDSVLLLIMDIADRPNDMDDGFMDKWYAPADQAVVISGDMDSKTVASKLRSMSYMIPARESAVRPEYVRREEDDSISITVLPGNTSLSRISATWTSERPPREYMNTVQPEIFEKFLNTLGTAAVNRIKKSLKTADVPVADVSYGHVCSSTYPYDDSVTISVVAESSDAGKVADTIAEVMASIDMYGVGKNEYLIAESHYIHELTEKVDRSYTPNSEYMDRCVHSFLYNSSLASSKGRLAFHTSRSLPDTMRLRLFNDIAKAVIDTVWTSSAPDPSDDIVIPDTLESPVVPVKLKLKSTRKEPVSGGVIWTFSNGFKVVYRKMESDRIYYGFALNGGYGSLNGLESGEGAFLTDYLGTCRVAGMEAERFIEVLGKDGVIMDLKVNMSNTMVSGSLPKERMPLLLRSLLALANERTPDEVALDYYRRSEYLALDNAAGGRYARMTAIDSIICPGYRYSPYKVKGKMAADFRKKAEAFYERQFSKTDDGTLILVGNMEEEKLKKLLLSYVGGFRTSNGVARKPVMNYQAVSGTSTYTVKGEEDNIDVVMSSRLPVTMENYAAAEFAVMALERKLLKELEGVHVEVAHECWIYPEERLNVLITLSDTSDPLATLAEVRSALSGLHDTEISDAMLKNWKAMLKHAVAMEMKTPAYWVDAIALRYLVGKDLSTGYAPKIDAITPAKVKSVLSLLDDGCKVEYVTIKK